MLGDSLKQAAGLEGQWLLQLYVILLMGCWGCRLCTLSCWAAGDVRLFFTIASPHPFSFWVRARDVSCLKNRVL